MCVFKGCPKAVTGKTGLLSELWLYFEVKEGCFNTGYLLKTNGKLLEPVQTC